MKICESSFKAEEYLISAHIFRNKILCYKCKETESIAEKEEDVGEVEGEEFTLEDLIDEDYIEEDENNNLHTPAPSSTSKNSNIDSTTSGYAYMKCVSTGKKKEQNGEKIMGWFYVCTKHSVKTRITTGTLFERSKIGIHQILLIFWCCLNSLTYTQACIQLKDEGIICIVNLYIMYIHMCIVSLYNVYIYIFL